MKTVRVGLGRLYSVMRAAHSLVNRKDEALRRYCLGAIDVEAYLGPHPRHVFLNLEFEPPQPKDPEAPRHTSRRRAFEMLPPEKFPADFYVELVATEAIEVDDALAAAFQCRDDKASSEISRRAREGRLRLTAALDYVAGVIGLRLHSLLVRTPVVEQHYAYRDGGAQYQVGTYVRLAAGDTYDWGVSQEGLVTIKGMPRIEERWTWERAAEVLAWLLRAWAAEDPVLKFVSSFIPLECIIPSPPIEGGDSWELRRKAVLAIVGREVAQNRDDLLEFVNGLQPPSPALASRFGKWAAGASLPGWQQDVAAFKKFQRMRNQLVHAGKRGFEPRVSVGADDVRALEDITERYVNLALFGDTSIYQRPERPA
jgi:hypothetical protein